MTRLNNRVKQEFWYAPYTGTATVLDDNGHEIGQHATYGNPIHQWGNIYVAHGTVYHRQYGIDEDYTHSIMVEDRDTPIDEYSILWVGVTPQLNPDGSLATDEAGNALTPYNHIVKRISRGLPKYGVAIIYVSQVATS